MYKAINYDPLDTSCVYIDVRSESEYKKGHIPRAINLPILNDEERHIVGDLYKNVSVADARRKGLSFVIPKLLDFYDAVSDINKKNPRAKIIFYCARGGYRSTSVALLLRGIGVPVFWVSGGYKSYRQIVASHLADEAFYPDMIVLHGLSGVGKTHLLKELSSRGMHCLDLEGIAFHKGSHLGHIGIDKVQTQQNFENKIFDSIISTASSYLFVESESKRIGNVLMPQALFNKIQNGTHLLVEADIDFRVELLVNDYVNFAEFDEQFLVSLKKLTIYTGEKFINEIIQLLHQKNYQEITRKLLLEYYDPLYNKSICKHNYNMTFYTNNISKTAGDIINWLSDSEL